MGEYLFFTLKKSRLAWILAGISFVTILMWFTNVSPTPPSSNLPMYNARPTINLALANPDSQKDNDKHGIRLPTANITQFSGRLGTHQPIKPTMLINTVKRKAQTFSSPHHKELTPQRNVNNSISHIENAKQNNSKSVGIPAMQSYFVWTKNDNQTKQSSQLAPGDGELPSIGNKSQDESSSSDTLRCYCTTKNIDKGEETLKTMNTMIRWLNHTTKDELLYRHPNFPVHMTMEMGLRGKCHLMPSYQRINWKNTYWQEANLSDNVQFLAYSAIYDNRTATDIRPCVRIIGVTRSVDFSNKPWCQFWFNSTLPPIIAKAQRIEYLDYQKKNGTRQMPYLVSCPIPPHMAHLKPSAVSLVNEPCVMGTTLLQVIGEGERGPSAFRRANRTEGASRVKPHAAAVCGPALYYFHQDFSFRLVEWLEILRSKDIARVFLYETDVHPNVQKVLRHYEAQGFVNVTKYSYPSPYVNEPSIRRLWTLSNRQAMFAQENIYFTDCLLRHMHEYRFISHYDPDEVPVLLKHQSYTDFLQQILEKSNQELREKKKPLPHGYQLHWKMFYDDLNVSNNAQKLPEYLYMLRHTLTTMENLQATPGTFKTLHDMDFVTGIYSHNVLLCASGRCKSKTIVVPSDNAYLAHFSWKCGDKCKEPSSTVEDTRLVSHREEIQAAVEEVLKKLDLL